MTRPEFNIFSEKVRAKLLVVAGKTGMAETSAEDIVQEALGTALGRWPQVRRVQRWCHISN